MGDNVIPYGRQYVSEEDVKAVNKVLTSNYLTTGPKVQEFEKHFAKKVGAKYAVAVSNGTAALHVACLAAGLEKGQEIITSPMTFAASANCALYCGAKPQFVDITPQGVIEPSKIEAKITPNTKIIIPVDYSGMPCDLERIHEIAEKHDLRVIQDSCHALGAKYKQTQIGDCTYSDMSVFSFHPVKHITTGEGGMITTNSEELYEKLKLYRTHGITKNPSKMQKNEGPWFYEMQVLGYNYRITDIQCALGISQLQRIDEIVERRREIAHKYDQVFTDNPQIELLKEKPDQYSAYHLYPILLKNPDLRKKLFNILRKEKIWVQVHYIPVYWHPYYQDLGYQKGLTPDAEEFYQREISIPMYPTLSDNQLNQVIKIILRAINRIS